MMNYLEKKKKAMLNYVSGGRLPSEYQECEYIESHRTERIDCGMVADQDTDYEMVLMPLGIRNYEFILSARTSTSSNRYELGWGTGATYIGWYNGSLNLATLTNDTKYKFEKVGLQILKDDTVVQNLQSRTFTTPVNLNIFCSNTNGTYGNYAKIRLYSLKIYQDNTLEREFVPCYRKADDVIGLYDLVYGTFYTNAGSGTFTKGQDV